MKLVDAILDSNVKDTDQVKKPCLLDFMDIISRDAIVHKCYYTGLDMGLSIDQTMILIIQGLYKDKNEILKQLKEK